MPYQFVFYPRPPNAPLIVTPDSGGALHSVPYTNPTDGRPGQTLELYDGTPNNNGAALDFPAGADYGAAHMRGLLMLEEATKTAYLRVDDFALPSLEAIPPPTGPTPPPNGPETPEQIIMRVFNETHPNLASVPGCGKFTEDCCTALHEGHNPAWGHIAKTAGQNQFNGHAVDALMLLFPVTGTEAGVYDIIFSSASQEAKPVFNYAHPVGADYVLWHYPAGAVYRVGVDAAGQPALLSYRVGVDGRGLPVLRAA